MAVHRISDSAEAYLQLLAKKDGVKPGEFLDRLVTDYAAGLTFARDQYGRADIDAIKADA